MHLVQDHLTGRVRSTFSLTGTPTCSSLNAFPSSTTVRKGSTASMDSPKSAWRVSACGQERCNGKTNQLFQPRVVTLVADKLETVVRRMASESNCIRELERMMVQPQLCDQKKKGLGD